MSAELEIVFSFLVLENQLLKKMNKMIKRHIQKYRITAIKYHIEKGEFAK